MKVEIKNRFSGEIILCGKYESIKDCLEKNRGADLRGANLCEANLYGANLYEANLYGANLCEANLCEANLYEANLCEANLRFKDNPHLLPDLYSLKLLPKNTKLRYWKYLKNGVSPYQDFKYEAGKEYKFDDADSDEKALCSKGGNVATLMWCLKDNLDADEFIEVEFQVKDICAVPFATDGKFRVKKFKVVKQYTRKQVVKKLQKVMG